MKRFDSNLSSHCQGKHGFNFGSRAVFPIAFSREDHLSILDDIRKGLGYFSMRKADLFHVVGPDVASQMKAEIPFERCLFGSPFLLQN